MWQNQNSPLTVVMVQGTRGERPRAKGRVQIDGWMDWPIDLSSPRPFPQTARTRLEIFVDDSAVLLGAEATTSDESKDVNLPGTKGGKRGMLVRERERERDGGKKEEEAEIYCGYRLQAKVQYIRRAEPV
jgi:hypothetical protein